MQVVVEKREGAEFSLKVEMPKEKVKEEFSRAFRRLVKDTQIPGFRKGKIPRKIFERRFGTQIIREEAMKGLFPQVYEEIVNEHKLVPIVDPELEVIQLAEDKPLILRVNLITRPETKLGKYRGIKIKARKTDVLDDEVTVALRELQKQYVDYVSVEGRREAREGDRLILDWQAFFEGEKLPEEKGEDSVLQLNSNILPKPLFEGLIGSKVGEHKRIEVQFPPEHPRKDFAGRKITFQITVKEIKEEVFPPLDDEFAKNLNFKDLKSLKERLRENIKRAKEERERRRIREEIVKRVVDDAQIEVPPSLERKKVEERIERLKQDLKNQGRSLQDYLEEEGLKEEDLRERIKSRVREELKTFFVLEAIAEKEKIHVSEEELETRLRSATGGQREEKIRKLKARLSKEGRLDSIVGQMRMEKVIDFLYREAEINLN